MEKGSPKSNMLKTPVSKSSMLKSPIPKSPMPKSPMPKSPIPKSPVAYEEYKSRCVHGLISFFHFRHRHSKKLISDTDRRSLNRDALGDGHIGNKLDLHSDEYNHDVLDKKSMILDSGYARVEKIKGANLSVEQQIKKKIVAAKVENAKSDSQLLDDLLRNHRKAIKTSRRSRRLPIYGCYDVSTVEHRKPTHQNLADGERSSKSSDSEVSAVVLLHPKNESVCNCIITNSTQHKQVNEINLQVNMKESTEAFINQKLIDGKQLSGDGTSYQSKHFLDALEILNSNKDLFIKLLQDPNSLLVKHIEDLRDSQEKKQLDKSFTKAELSEHQARNTREGNLHKETGDFQPLEKIVVFRPRPESLQNCADHGISHDTPHIHYGLRNVQQSVRPAFFAKQMRRKLMHAMGLVRKEQQLMPTDGPSHQKSINDLEGFRQCGKGKAVDIVNRNSPDKASSKFGGMSKSSINVKRKHQMDKVNEFVPVVRDEAASTSESGHENSHLSTVKHPKRNKHNVYVEPRVHISELKIGNPKFLRKQKIKTWDGISSGPLKQNVEALPWAIKQKQPQMYETRPNISYSPFPDDQECRNIDSLNNDLSIIETNYGDSEEIVPPGVPSKPDSSYNDGVSPSTETVDTCEKSGSLGLSREDSLVENQTSTYSIDDNSTSPLKSQIFRESDTIKDKEEQPSPVSVLDQFLTEEIISPANTEPHSALQSIRLLQIGMEEGCLADHQFPSDLKMSTFMEGHRSMFEHISTVLQSCHFSWDELAFKCHLSEQLHNQSLLDNRYLRPNHFCGHDWLLFDFLNEVLVDVNRWYLRCSPWLSFMKPKILPATMTGSVAQEVIKNVDWNLFLAPSQTLEQLLVKDLTKSRTWMDIRTDAEDAVSEMVDSLLEELIIEFALE
ncbi:hypothetical protein P3X46_030058 [Hevea brasiliensis]|uniref:DUF4378 domain-containing protein n=2 Tax=Hevea brasiliensis TaxID=3981 RepID=A0ABQ9KU65_HEVBR|nr:uncharacterized protein LOC110656102 isoform X1 [Hevea brasiliensis]XP_057994153.1 uncharacterized protein LOC110656102 isoform X1 [Hevea brasiliensis]KAJ9147946.1 hypothetical protein P3X46_030058 [Hevea brasiliensis]